MSLKDIVEQILEDCNVGIIKCNYYMNDYFGNIFYIIYYFVRNKHFVLLHFQMFVRDRKK